MVSIATRRYLCVMCVIKWYYVKANERRLRALMYHFSYICKMLFVCAPLKRVDPKFEMCYCHCNDWIVVLPAQAVEFNIALPCRCYGICDQSQRLLRKDYDLLHCVLTTRHRLNSSNIPNCMKQVKMGLFYILANWACYAMSYIFLMIAVAFLVYCLYIKHIHMKYDHIPGPPRDG